MLPEETTELITRLSLVDGRIAPSDPAGFEAVVSEWHGYIGHLDFPDALDVARAHYATSTDRLMPAHVIAGVARLTRQRVAALPRVEELMADVDPDHPRYDAIRDERRAQAMRRPTARPSLPRA